MNVMHLAWRNVGRNKRRSVLAVLAVAFACAALVFSMSLQKGSYADMIYNTVHSHTGHVQIQRVGYLEDRELAKKLEQPDDIMALIARESGIVAMAPRVNAAALVSKDQRTFGAMVFGIDPEREAAATRLDEVVRAGKYLEAGDPDGVLVGEQLARNLEASVGDEIVFLGQGADGSLAAGRLFIRGIYRFGSGELDRATIVAPLVTIQEAFSLQGAVSEVALLLDSDKERLPLVERLQTRLQSGGFEQAVVLGWPELMPGIEQSIKVDWISGLIMYAVLVLVVGFGIANTFLMAFMERIRECGVMLSLGMRPLSLSVLLYLESALLTVLGVAVGVATGSLIVLYYGVRGISFGEQGAEIMQEYGMSGVIHPQLTSDGLLWTILIVTAISLAVAVYPAVKAAKLRPVDALRHT